MTGDRHAARRLAQSAARAPPAWRERHTSARRTRTALLLPPTGRTVAAIRPGAPSREDHRSAGTRLSRSAMQEGVDLDHRSVAAVDGVDDLGVVDALEADRGDADVAVTELALDDDQGHAFVGHLDGV